MYDITHLWHDKNSNQYFVRKGEKILFKIPKWVGRILFA